MSYNKRDKYVGTRVPTSEVFKELGDMRDFSIVLDSGKIVLRGGLAESDGASVKSFFASLPPGAYTIEASKASVDPNAVTMWIEAVNPLADYRFHYGSSQLAMILEYDKRYTHAASSRTDPDGDNKFGIWGGREPGGWCHIYMPEVEPYFGAHMGTQEQAEKGATSFRSDYPDYKYEVIPFDPNKEPEGKVSKPSARQLKAMVSIKDLNPEMGRGASQRFFILTPKNTRDSLFMRGWVMYIHDGGGLDLGVRLTKVGREVLARYGT